MINYEEGAENNILHGDPASESLLTEFGFVPPRQGERYLPVESQYEYGSRVGFWRLHRLFTSRNVSQFNRAYEFLDGQLPPFR